MIDLGKLGSSEDDKANAVAIEKARNSGKPYIVFEGAFKNPKAGPEITHKLAVFYPGYNDTNHVAYKVNKCGFKLLEYGNIGGKEYGALANICSMAAELNKATAAKAKPAKEAKA